MKKILLSVIISIVAATGTTWVSAAGLKESSLVRLTYRPYCVACRYYIKQGELTADERQSLLDQMNLARYQGRQCGDTYYGPAQPLTWNIQLEAAAHRHATDMATNNITGHTGSDGTDPGARIVATGYKPAWWGENVYVEWYTTFPGTHPILTQVGNAVNWWLNSPGHCANIMNPNFTQIGASVGFNPNGNVNVNGKYQYYFTADFGTPQ